MAFLPAYAPALINSPCAHPLPVLDPQILIVAHQPLVCKHFVALLPREEGQRSLYQLLLLLEPANGGFWTR